MTRLAAGQLYLKVNFLFALGGGVFRHARACWRWGGDAEVFLQMCFWRTAWLIQV